MASATSKYHHRRVSPVPLSDVAKAHVRSEPSRRGPGTASTRPDSDTPRNKDGMTAMTEARLEVSRSAMRPESTSHVAATSEIDALPRAVQTAAGTPLWNLTPQQWRVFLLVGKALSNKAIAHELRVAESTVKAHVSAIFKMAGCRNRTEAALLSQRVRYGLLDADDALPSVAAQRR